MRDARDRKHVLIKQVVELLQHFHPRRKLCFANETDERPCLTKRGVASTISWHKRRARKEGESDREQEVERCVFEYIEGERQREREREREKERERERESGREGKGERDRDRARAEQSCSILRV